MAVPLLLLILIAVACSDTMCREMQNINASSAAFENLSIFKRCFETTECEPKESTRSLTSGGFIRLVYTCRLPEPTLPPSQLSTAADEPSVIADGIDLGMGFTMPKEWAMAAVGVVAVLLLVIMIILCCCCIPGCLSRSCDAIRCVRRPNRGVRVRPTDDDSEVTSFANRLTMV